MIIYIGGIPGVGKTSIIREIERKASTQNIKLVRTIGTDIMCKLAGVLTVEELRKLPEEVRKKFRLEMNRQIYQQDRLDFNTIRVCDGHFCFFDINGKKYGKRQIYPGDKEQIRAIVVILASPQIILARRLKDYPMRSDRQKNLKSIEKEQNMEIQTALDQAKNLNLAIGFIINNHNKITEEAELLLSLIMQWIQVQ